MSSLRSYMVCISCCVLLADIHPARADNGAAPQYPLAILQLRFGRLAPEYVQLATTDDLECGFPSKLSDGQVTFLSQTSVASSLGRFDDATSRVDCAWPRYTETSWSAANLNVHLHHLARIALLRARSHYEAGRWLDGNRDVERVRIMARHMIPLARPFEHQCFGDYRENAQGICRGIMMEDVSKRLQRGKADFNGIKDPFGANSLEVRKHETGFALVSELRHPSRIEFGFGLAGP